MIAKQVHVNYFFYLYLPVQLHIKRPVETTYIFKLEPSIGHRGNQEENHFYSKFFILILIIFPMYKLIIIYHND